MKIYSRDAHPIAQETSRLVHDTNQALSRLYYIEKALEAEDYTKAKSYFIGLKKSITNPIDKFYKFISEHEELI